MHNCVITRVVSDTCKWYVWKNMADTNTFRIFSQNSIGDNDTFRKNTGDTDIATFTNTFQYCNM